MVLWNVRRNDGGDFEAWVDGQTEDQHMKAKNQSELKRQMSSNNGFTDELRDEVFRQLAVGTTAKVEVPRLGKFSQFDLRR